MNVQKINFNKQISREVFSSTCRPAQLRGEGVEKVSIGAPPFGIGPKHELKVPNVRQ